MQYDPASGLRPYVFLSAIMVLFICATFVGLGDSPERAAANGVNDNGSAELRLRASHGYRVRVDVFRRRARLVVAKGHMAAVYLTGSAGIDKRGIHARFGHRGGLRMAFKARNGSPMTDEDSCGTGQSVTGVFQGAFRFRGEHGFTEVKAERAFGRMGKGSRYCGAGVERTVSSTSASAGPKVQGFTLGGRGYLRFAGGVGAVHELESWETAEGVPLGLESIRQSQTPFTAIRSTRAEGMRIVRLAAAAGGSNGLTVKRDGKSSVVPPPPFHGRGHLAACRLSSWAGDLAVNFPGERISLTAPRIWVSVAPVAVGAC